MKRLLYGFIASLFLISNSWSATGWVKTKPLGSASPSTIDDSQGENNAALDLVLSKFRQGCEIVYASAATLTVNSGAIVVSNSAGTVRLMLANSASTSVAWTDIDTGSEATSTTYYIYAIASATTDTTFTIKISASATAPSGVTYYRKLGSFYNDASGNITAINNDDNLEEIGSYTSKTSGVNYQALTDGFVVAWSSKIEVGAEALTNALIGYTDGTSTPTTVVAEEHDVVNPPYVPIGYSYGSIMFPVKKGDYYRVDGTSVTMWFVPFN